MLDRTCPDTRRPFHILRRATHLIGTLLLAQTAEPATAKSFPGAEQTANAEAARLAQIYATTGAFSTSCFSAGAFNGSRYMETAIVRDSYSSGYSNRDSFKRFLKFHKKDDPAKDTIVLKSWNQVFDYIRSNNYSYNFCYVDGTVNIPSLQHVAYMYLATRPKEINFTSQVLSESYSTPTGGPEFSRYSDTGRLYNTPNNRMEHYATGHAHIKGTRSLYIEFIKNNEDWYWYKYPEYRYPDELLKPDGMQTLKEKCLDFTNNIRKKENDPAGWPGGLERCLAFKPDLIDDVVASYNSRVP